MVSLKFRMARFDVKAVSREVKRVKPLVTSKQAGGLRLIARRSILKRKKSSESGRPPHSHTGLLRKLLVYDYDPTGEGSAVIGSMKSNQVFFEGDGKPITGPVPNVLEFGGDIRILEVFKPWLDNGKGRWVRADLRSRRRMAYLKRRFRNVKVKARPYMGPALEKAKSTMADFWKGALRGE